MDKLTRLYKIMYGSMDSLFVKRREQKQQLHHSSGQTSKDVLLNINTISTTNSVNSKRPDVYSSMIELNDDQNSIVQSEMTLSKFETSNQICEKETIPNTLSNHLHQLTEDRGSSGISTQGDSDSCHSDSYPLTYKPVLILNEGNHNHQILSSRPTRVLPFTSRTLSQSSQSLPVSVSNSTTSASPLIQSNNKGSFSNLLTRKKNKKSKSNIVKGEQEATISTESKLTQVQSFTHLYQASASSISSTKKELQISSLKDLVEVLIYQLQIMERQQDQLEMQCSNFQKANKVNLEKIRIATRENELLKQKLSMVENEIWKCFLCSRDKIQLYTNDVAVVVLMCGHLFCADCSSGRIKCPKCVQPFTIDRRVHF